MSGDEKGQDALKATSVNVDYVKREQARLKIELLAVVGGYSHLFDTSDALLNAAEKAFIWLTE